MTSLWVAWYNPGVFELKLPLPLDAAPQPGVPPPAPEPPETPSPAPANKEGRGAGGLFAVGNEIAPGGHYSKDPTVLAAEAEDIARRVMRDGGHITMTALARELGWTTERLRGFLQSPIYRNTFAKVSEEFYGSIDQHIKDERMDSLVRANALQARGLTVLGDILDIVKGHADQVRSKEVLPRATLIKAGVDAVAEARQTAAQLRGQAAQHGTTNVQINITGKHGALIQGAMKEAGLNLSDVLEGYIDAEVVDEKGV